MYTFHVLHNSETYLRYFTLSNATFFQHSIEKVSHTLSSSFPLMTGNATRSIHYQFSALHEKGVQTSCGSSGSDSGHECLPVYELFLLRVLVTVKGKYDDSSVLPHKGVYSVIQFLEFHKYINIKIN